MFLGDQLLAYLVLAMGGALLVGNVLALVKPPPATKDGSSSMRLLLAAS